MSIKRRIKDLQSFDWDQAMEVLRLRNQGWTYTRIGQKLNLTPQRSHQIYRQVSGMTVEEAELYQRVLTKLPIYNKQ